MAAYYNEIDPYAAQWLRNLIVAGHIAPGDVDERSIANVAPDDLRGFTQCHFFAGIGGWSYALRLAGWPDSRPVWTGSCPCQPFSSASRGRTQRLDSEQHLWPEWRRLIAAIKPRVVFGEQVAQAGDWLDVVAAEMDEDGYEFGVAVLPALCVGADHIRERIYFAGHADRGSESGLREHAEAPRLPGHRGVRGQLDEAHGLPRRMAVMRAFGNAIVPQVAAEFIGAVMEDTGHG